MSPKSKITIATLAICSIAIAASAQSIAKIASDDMSLLTFALSVASAIVLVLGGLAWWLVKERIRSNEREKETLHKRLGAGSEQMEKLRNTIQDVKDFMIKYETRFVTCDEFKAYQAMHSGDHVRLKDQLDEIRSEQGATRGAITAMGERIESSIKTMVGLLNKRVYIKNPEEEKC